MLQTLYEKPEETDPRTLRIDGEYILYRSNNKGLSVFGDGNSILMPGNMSFVSVSGRRNTIRIGVNAGVVCVNGMDNEVWIEEGHGEVYAGDPGTIIRVGEHGDRLTDVQALLNWVNSQGLLAAATVIDKKTEVKPTLKIPKQNVPKTVPRRPFNAEEVCSICFDAVAKEDRRYLQCSHFFHSICVATWLSRTQSCPLCKAPTN